MDESESDTPTPAEILLVLQRALERARSTVEELEASVSDVQDALHPIDLVLLCADALSAIPCSVDRRPSIHLWSERGGPIHLGAMSRGGREGSGMVFLPRAEGDCSVLVFLDVDGVP